MNTTFEQSKHFELTPGEIEYLNLFIDKIIVLYHPKTSTRFLSRGTEAETIAKTIPVEKEEWRWFLGRALLGAFEQIVVTESGGNIIFKKTLPDRSQMSFGIDNLRETLYDIGRFYLAKTFDHSYESLKNLSKQWIVLDNYVEERKQIIKIKKLEDKLPEIEGIFR